MSAFGDWVAISAIGLHVKDLTGSALLVAALWACLFGPSVLAARPAGLVTDRFEATRVLAVTSGLGVLAALAVAVAPGAAAVLALTAALGVVFAVSGPAEFALIPCVAPGERGLRALNGHVETARYVGFGLGPLVGGAVHTAAGFEAAMALDAATFLAVAVAALALRVRRPPVVAAAPRRPSVAASVLRVRRPPVVGPAPTRPRLPRRRRTDGGDAGLLLGDEVLRPVMLVAFTALAFMSAVWVAQPFFLDDDLGQGGMGYGVMLSCWTAGMALGAVVVARRVATAALTGVALVAVTVQGVFFALPAALPSFAFLLFCAVLAGVAQGVKNVSLRSLIHLRVPAELHGRTAAAYNAMRNAAELGAFAVGGLLVAAAGARTTLAYAGGLAALCGVAGLLAAARGRRARVRRPVLAWA